MPIWLWNGARAQVVRRLLGRVLIAGGAAIVALSALVASGLLPLWRPSVPPPPSEVLASAPRSTVVAVGSPLPVLGAVRQPVVRASPSATPDAPAALAVLAGTADEYPIAPWTPTAPPTRTPPPSPTPRPSATLWPSPTPWPSLTPWPSPTPLPSATPQPTPTPQPTAVPPLPPPGLPLRLAIPSIKVDTPVVPLDVRADERGNLEWETVPFVAGHYGVTGLVGAKANVVLSGHVATQGLGNVFRDLYRLRPNEPIVVYTAEGEFTYRVEKLQLVRPEEVDVLAPSVEPQLTLLTCAGEFDFRTRSFNQRLVVVARLVS